MAIMQIRTKVDYRALGAADATKTERKLCVSLANVQDELVQSLRSLARNLERVAENVGKHGSDASVNSLGEVQGQGPAIDVMCARRRALIEALEAINS